MQLFPSGGWRCLRCSLVRHLGLSCIDPPLTPQTRHIHLNHVHTAANPTQATSLIPLSNAISLGASRPQAERFPGDEPRYMRGREVAPPISRDVSASQFSGAAAWNCLGLSYNENASDWASRTGEVTFLCCDSWSDVWHAGEEMMAQPTRDLVSPQMAAVYTFHMFPGILGLDIRSSKRSIYQSNITTLASTRGRYIHTSRPTLHINHPYVQGSIDQEEDL